jgi:MFS superfamily sulfate permease-like transporter
MSTAAATEEAAQDGRLRRYFPIFGWLPSYERAWLVKDALAGLSVWALLVPQSLAYATIVGVPVQYGLYTAFAALLVYPLFGTSKQLVVGPSATVGAVSAAVVTPLVGADAPGTDEAAAYSAALALAVAVVYLALGLLRMGWISTFLSKAVMSGFILGFAIGIIINQAHSLLGVPGVDGSYMQQLWGTIEEIPDTNGATLVVGAASLGLLLLMRYTAPKLPRALIVVVLSIIAVSAFDLADEGVAVIGDVPTGLFSIGLPGIGSSDVGSLLIGALAVVFVGYSETLAAARSVARKHRYEIDTNQELIAQGMANGAAGLVGGFVVDGSLSKTSVADDAGQRSQMASLIDALFVLATLLFLATLFENLPSATLAAIVIDAMIGLITFAPLRRYYRVNRADFAFFTGPGSGSSASGSWRAFSSASSSRW